MADKPSVLFVCVHNAGRSQMAAALLSRMAGERIEVRSAGTEPAGEVNPVAVAAMADPLSKPRFGNAQYASGSAQGVNG